MSRVQIPVRQCVSASPQSDYDEALRFYRDVLGLREQASYTSPPSVPGGRVTILEAGRGDAGTRRPRVRRLHRQVEVGTRVAGHIRVAFEVADSPAGPRGWPTPARRSSRRRRVRRGTRSTPGLAAPAGLQVTIFAIGRAER
jgi:catechol 2,3-dioxygenase-like lactoylglutathione lyase family enzyme